MTTLVIHGHFYQPPRENPWTETVDREPSAAPFHDWNQRVHDECYRANAWARVFDQYGRIDRLVNNYERLSFNFGPTVLSWMERFDPMTYARILEADRASVAAQGGHGNAIAQGYNHAILPLCSARDRATQVRWGVADFRHRFGRAPESLWLPETAADDATLDLLTDEGLRWVILAPSQAQRVRPQSGYEDWRDVGDGSIDPGRAYRRLHRDGSGRSIAVFFYDGPIARGIAFEGALASSQTLVARLGAARGGDGRLIHVATDGESYGHHHPHGDRTLAYALDVEATRHGLAVSNYGRYLDEHPPRHDVEIKGGEGTAWSCAHGVGRWYRDCGCSTYAQAGWNQAWRTPLRRALDLLRDWGAAVFEDLGGQLFTDPWGARDDYIELLLAGPAAREEWLARRTRRRLGEGDRLRALTLLEAQRHGQLMYTSCGWFFADVSGIETQQVLRYAARATELHEELDLEPPREAFLDALAEARSNLPAHGTGADLFRRTATAGAASPARIAAHLALSGLVEEAPPPDDVGSYDCRLESFARERHGRLTLITTRVDLEHVRTGRRHELAAAALYMGGVDFYCVVRALAGARRFHVAAEHLRGSLRSESLPVLLRRMQEELGPEEFGLEGVLPGAEVRISQLVLGTVIGDLVGQYVRVYEQNQRVLELLHRLGFELPPALRAAAEVAYGHRFAAALDEARGSRSEHAYRRAALIAAEATTRGIALDRDHVGETLAHALTEAVRAALHERTAGTADAAAALAALAERLGMSSASARAQELCWSARDAASWWPRELHRLVEALGFAPPDGASSSKPTEQRSGS